MNRSLQRGGWLAALLGAGAAVLYLWLVFVPQMKSISALREQLRTKQDYIARTQRSHASMDQARKDLAETRRYAATWRDRCPDERGLTELFSQISKLCKQGGATTRRFEPQPRVPYDSIQKTPVALAIGGSFSAVQRLLSGLEALPALGWIDELKIKTQSETGQDVLCELTLVVFADPNKKSD